MSMHEDEPVGYLGGEVGSDPYGGGDDEEIAGYLEGSSGDSPYADSNPYGSSPNAFVDDDEEIAGYLEGASGEDEMPMLPPVEEPEGNYSAKDFIDSDPAMDAYDPYAEDDPYAASGEDYGYDDYQESDASYFDEMAHTEEPATQKYAEESADDYDYDDPDQPKTISQQDAESIIRRITTKRIVPPEAESRPKAAAQQSYTQSGGGLRIWPLLFAFLILAGVGGFLFKGEIGEFLAAQGYPEAAALFGWVEPEPTVVPVAPKETPEEKRTRILRETVLKSELKAFGLKEKDLKRAPASTPDAGGGDGAAQGGN